jgi:phage tail tape-measure protein
MAAGAVAGPVGAAIGAAVGAVAGGYAGKGVGEMIDPTTTAATLGNPGGQLFPFEPIARQDGLDGPPRARK